MTVNELIEKLKRYDGSSLVVINSCFSVDYMGVREIYRTQMNKGKFNEKEIVVIHNDDDDFELDEDAWYYEKKKEEK